MSQQQTQGTGRKTYSNSGLLRKNTKNPEKSDYNGGVTVTCPNCNAEFEMWLNGWKKTFQNGDKVLSLSLKPKEARTEAPAPPPGRPAPPQAQAAAEGDPFEDVPF